METGRSTPALELMTIEDVAGILRIPTSSVYKLAQDGKLPGFKIGRHWRFLRSRFEQWVVEQAAPPNPNNSDSKPV